MYKPENGATPRFVTGQDHSNYECGLISEQDMPLYLTLPPEDEELALFDELSERTSGGWIFFRDTMLRIDVKLENDNLVRSVVETRINDSGVLGFVTSNLIQHRNRNYYLEVHPGYVDDDGAIWEPPVGGSDVSAAPHGAMVIHYQVAYEGLPAPSLPKAA